MVNDHPKWNFEEFLSFLLLYSAFADMEYDAVEMDFILNKVDPDHYHNVKDEIDRMNDIEILQVIERYRGLYFPTVAQRDELLAKVEELFRVDGDYSPVEQYVFRLLKRIL